MIDSWAWRGRIRVIATYKDGTQQIDEFSNLITDAGISLLRDALKGTATDCQIKYLALGSDNTVPAGSDTTLGAEEFRKVVTRREDDGAGGLITTVIISAFEANDFVTEEIGWFATPTATSATDSGILVARVLYTRAKTELESLQIERTDTIGGV